MSVFLWLHRHLLIMLRNYYMLWSIISQRHVKLLLEGCASVALDILIPAKLVSVFNSVSLTSWTNIIFLLQNFCYESATKCQHDPTVLHITATKSNVLAVLGDHTVTTVNSTTVHTVTVTLCGSNLALISIHSFSYLLCGKGIHPGNTFSICTIYSHISNSVLTLFYVCIFIY